jgi:hypothetical protein
LKTGAASIAPLPTDHGIRIARTSMEHFNDCTRHPQTVVLVDALSASSVQSAPLRPINAIDESLQAQPP